MAQGPQACATSGGKLFSPSQLRSPALPPPPFPPLLTCPAFSRSCKSVSCSAPCRSLRSIATSAILPSTFGDRGAVAVMMSGEDEAVMMIGEEEAVMRKGGQQSDEQGGTAALTWEDSVASWAPSWATSLYSSWAWRDRRYSSPSERTC